MSVLVQETSGLKKSENSAITSGKSEGEKERPPVNKRANKHNFSRSSSFRNKHRIKLLQEIEAMAGYGRGKNDSRFWRIRHFGHYDLQSVSVDRIEYQSNKGDTHHRLKKHTGASAALLNHLQVNGEDSNLETGAGNNLVAPCPSFTNEVGSNWLPKDSPLLKLREVLSQEKKMRIYSRERAVLDNAFATDTKLDTCQLFTVQSGITYPLEYIDFGACYYRDYFYGKDHHNFVGSEDGIGPIVISFRRQKVPEDVLLHFSHGQPTNDRGLSKYQYRIIVRTSEIPTLRGTVLEETIPTSSKTSSSRGIPPREVIEYVTQGEIQISSLKLAKNDDKVHREIMRVDEQDLNNRCKIGVLYCKAGQTTEEEWYNNETGSKAFDEFLELVGMKVKMKGFTKFRAQLDNKTDTTGEYSVYTEYENSEIMFHVSTLLPLTENNKQQLLRKRHIGNDIVTLIFQEPGCEPFSPKSIRSHFQHIFIVVSITNPNSPLAEYKVAVSRSSDVPYFGPSIPESGIFQKSEKFRNFILTKLINACNAALQSDKLYAMASRTRKQYLNDIVKEHSSSVSLEQVGGGALGRLFGRKRERFGLVSPLLFTPGAITWSVSIITRHWKPLPFSEEHDFSLECILALSPDVLVVVDSDKVAILHIPTRDISGFSVEKNRVNLFYDNVYCLSLELHETEEDIQEFCKRLLTVSPAQEAILLEFSRSVISGLLGFTIDQDGAVVKVDGLAKMRGLQKGARVLQVEDKLVSTHTHLAIVGLLHNKHQTVIRAYVIPPVQRSDRPPHTKTTIDWEKVWALRPQMASELTTDTNDEKPRSEKGSPAPSEVSDADTQSQKHSPETMRNGSVSHRVGKPRKSRPNHLAVINPYQDDENIYDRLLTYDRSPGGVSGPPGSPSNKSTTSSIGPASPGSSSGRAYNRVKISSHKKGPRQTVLPLRILPDQRSVDGDSVEDERFSWTPVPAHHQIDDRSPYVNTRISQSTPIPDRSHVSSPLSSVRKPITPGALGERNPENLPHLGQVHEMTKRFSEYQRKPVSRTQSGSRKTTHVPIVVQQDQKPSLTSDMSPSRSNRSPNRRIYRPQSCELIQPGVDDLPVMDSTRGESLPPMSDSDNDPNDSVFRRSSQGRMAFRNKFYPATTSEFGYEFDRHTCKTEDDNMSEVTPVPPPLYSQSSGEDSLMAATKVLEELEKYISEDDTVSQESPKVTDEKINKLSVKARTHLWELKAHNRTLPSSFKTRTKSQPCSPLKTNSVGANPGGPVTPTTTCRKHSAFTFNTSDDSSLRRDESDSSLFQFRTGDDPSPAISTAVSSSVHSPTHRTLPLPSRRTNKGTPKSNGPNDEYQNHSHNSPSHPSTKSSPPTKHHPLQATKSDIPHPLSPVSKSEKHFRYERKPSQDSDQLTWDVVMGDISNYCRSVAEWVRQTENAGVLETPPQLPDSPTFSDTFSFTSSFQSENADKLKEKVERLEDKLDQESENNKELRQYLRKMEKQITDLQHRHTVRTKV